jgi:hypothetical protein
MRPGAAPERATRQVDGDASLFVENETDHRVCLVLPLATNTRAHG